MVWNFYIFPCTVNAKNWQFNTFFHCFSNLFYWQYYIITNVDKKFYHFQNLWNRSPFDKCTDFIILLHTFLVICFTRYNEWTTCLFSFNELSDAFSAWTCTSAIVNLWSMSFYVNSFFPSSYSFIANNGGCLSINAWCTIGIIIELW